MDLNKLNGSNFEKIFDDVDIDKYPFIKKEDALNKSYTVRACYITKSDYGYQSVLILDTDTNSGVRVGFSGRDLFDNITSDKDVIDAIKSHSLICKVVSYENKKYKKTCYKPHFECIPF